MNNILKFENEEQKKKNEFLPDLVKIGGKYISVNEVKDDGIEEGIEGRYVTRLPKVYIRTENKNKIDTKREKILNTFLHEFFHVIDISHNREIFEDNEFLIEYTTNKLHNVFIENPKFLRLFKEEYIQSDDFLEYVPDKLKLFGIFFDIYPDSEYLYVDDEIYSIYFNFSESEPESNNDYITLRSFLVNFILFEIINLNYSELKHIVHNGIESSISDINVPLLTESIHTFLSDNPIIIDLYKEQSNKLSELLAID